MNKIQKKIHQLVKIGINCCKDTDYQMISYRQHKKSCKEELKELKYTKEKIVKTSISKILEDISNH